MLKYIKCHLLKAKNRQKNAGYYIKNIKNKTLFQLGIVH
jgi:hypothetical protein